MRQFALSPILLEAPGELSCIINPVRSKYSNRTVTLKTCFSNPHPKPTNSAGPVKISFLRPWVWYNMMEQFTPSPHIAACQASGDSKTYQVLILLHLITILNHLRVTIVIIIIKIVLHCSIRGCTTIITMTCHYELSL